MNEWINECDFDPKAGEIYHVIGIKRDRHFHCIKRIVSKFYIFYKDKYGTTQKSQLEFHSNLFLDEYFDKPLQFKKINSLDDVEDELYCHELGISAKEYFKKTYFKKPVPKFDWSYC